MTALCLEIGYLLAVSTVDRGSSEDEINQLVASVAAIVNTHLRACRKELTQ